MMYLRLEDVVKIIAGKWSCTINGQQLDINNEEKITKYRNYVVTSMSACDDQLNLEIRPWESPTTKVDPNDACYQEHIKQFGTAPDYF